jgi:signal transduction histidine kinase
MKTTLPPLFLISLWLLSHSTYAQNAAKRDSLLRVLRAMPINQQDSSRVKLLNEIAFLSRKNKPDTTLLLGQQSYRLSQKINYPLGEGRALNVMATGYNQLGDYAKALTLYGKTKEIYVKLNNTERIIITLNNISDVYMQQGDWAKALELMQQTYQLYKNSPTADPRGEPVYLTNLGEDYYNLGQLDSAAYYLNKAVILGEKQNDDVIQVVYYSLGDVAMAYRRLAQARDYYQQGIEVATKADNFTALHESYYRIAKLYQKTSQPDSTLYFAKLALTFGQKASYPNGILKASQLLTSFYEGKNDSEALRYFKIATAAKDSLFSQDRVKQLLSYSFEEKQKQQEIEAAQAEYRNSLKNYIFGGLLAILAGIAAFFYRNIQREKKAKALLHRQKEEINLQRDKAEKVLTELKSTQAQLIQKEKLASLGELTAGIAHEIQNPLNFVNNFSELSVGIAQDLEDEIKNSPLTPNGGIIIEDKTYFNELISDLTQNQEKINHHGKRASSIVKGMLEHSRQSTGERELTNINQLADEYLRLAYHGLRAKNNSFNCDYELIVDENLPKIEVIPQDIGRVLLNLINNAFYAVNSPQTPDGGLKKVPLVTVATKYVAPPLGAGDGTPRGAAIEIKVTDNGAGIPAAILPKIFQPFFTTKPTGEGTGLGRTADAAEFSL